MITGLAVLHSEMAEAERLRLECSITKEECHRLNLGYTSCSVSNPAVSMLVDIDFEAETWMEFITHKDGTQRSASGKLRSVTQYEITLDERSYKDGRTDRETISRTTGAYSDVRRFLTSNGLPTEVIWAGSCNKTTKPLPSSKF
jgi:hypothetical protein